METIVDTQGELKMVEKKDDFNNYLTWANVWKAIVVLCSVAWFLTTMLKDNTVRDIKVDQITNDLKDIKGTVKEVQSDLKANGQKSDDRLNLLERNHELLKSEVQSIKSSLNQK